MTRGATLHSSWTVAEEMSGSPEAEVLLRVTAQANDALVIEDIYEPALAAVQALLGVERASILLFDDDDVMRFKAWHGLSEAYRQAVEGHSPWQRGAVDPLPFCTPDVELDADLTAYLPIFRAERIRGLAFVPLVCRGELLGKFMAYSEAPRLFSERELALVQAVAIQVAQAVARARLIEAERKARDQAERSVERTRRLLRVTSLLSNALRTEDVAALVVDEGTRAVSARSGGLWLREGDALVLIKQQGYPEEALSRLARIGLDEAIPVALAVRTGEPVWLGSPEAYASAFPELQSWVSALPNYSPSPVVASLPLRIRGDVVGVLALSFETLRELDESERTFLTLLAQHCVHGLERARLLQDAHAAEARARLLAQASAVLSSSLDCTTTLRNVADLAVPALADWCLVVARDGEDASCERAFKHVDADCALDAGALERALGEGASALAVALRAGEPALYAAADGPLAAPASGVRAAMTVPIRTQGRTIGSIVFGSESARTFTAQDLAMALQLGERTGVAIHNASLYQQAITAVELRDQFLSVAGHELRTPVTALLLQAQGLLRLDGAHEPGRLRERSERLTRYALRLTKLVDELLDVTRITSGRMQLTREALDLGDVVSDVLSGASEQIERTGSVVRVSAVPLAGRWDRHRLEQVVLNLLANALKYGEGKPIDITVAACEQGALLRVQDHGIGIADEHQRRIFGRFERAVSSRHFGGLGLGLWISRQIIEAHGGTIEVGSEPGQGAAFTVRLPLDAPATSPVPPG